jgi:hypothetical protein
MVRLRLPKKKNVVVVTFDLFQFQNGSIETADNSTKGVGVNPISIPQWCD